MAVQKDKVTGDSQVRKSQFGIDTVRGRLIAGGALLVIVAGITTWALWPDPEPREREYRDATACLLTGEEGIGAEPANAIWSSMQQISETTLVRVQNLPVSGPQTVDNAKGFVNSLTAVKCGVIVAVGGPQTAAVDHVASANPQVTFISVGGGTAAGNVQVVDAAGAPDAVSTELQELARNSS
ncbi:hypothetical protein Acy02nite_85610 [Actinoplanes cyaneus]|uniref:BMP family ABC transporter substrate-binding protein n=1 Tax=Actinoplanes cyaneus TaxID=52696 RepID=A0A919IR40_9ACTN|nr:hypothetical protein Acy02nite_85610 [Actinoplanes cyaneus]